MKEIQLTKGQVAQVSDDKFDYLNQFHWQAYSNGGEYYAGRGLFDENGKHCIELMHTTIMGKIDGFEIDHRDHCGLNNQNENLRFCTSSQNKMNMRPRKNSISKYKGVYFEKQCGKWRTRIKVDGKSIHLGLFINEIDAAMAYNLASPIYHGEFAYINVIID